MKIEPTHCYGTGDKTTPGVLGGFVCSCPCRAWPKPQQERRFTAGKETPNDHIRTETVSEWGGPCIRCGHPSSYHGQTFCVCEAGSATKKMCDCQGYLSPRCDCGWTGEGNHYHDNRMGRADSGQGGEASRDE